MVRPTGKQRVVRPIHKGRAGLWMVMYTPQHQKLRQETSFLAGFVYKGRVPPNPVVSKVSFPH